MNKSAIARSQNNQAQDQQPCILAVPASALRWLFQFENKRFDLSHLFFKGVHLRLHFSHTLF